MRYFQFSLRDCFLLVMIAAVALGWYIDRSHQAAQLQQKAAESEDYQWRTQALEGIAREEGYELTWTADGLSYVYKTDDGKLEGGGMIWRPFSISCKF